MTTIDEYLKHLTAKSGSDLHTIAGQPVRMRVYGDLTPVNSDVLSAEDARELLHPIMSAQTQKEFEAHDAADFAYSVEGVARFRVNVLRHLGGVGAVFAAVGDDLKRIFTHVSILSIPASGIKSAGLGNNASTLAFSCLSV